MDSPVLLAGRRSRWFGPYLQKGMFKEAVAEADRWREHDDSPWPLLAYVQIYGSWGRMSEARKALAEFREANRDGELESAPVLAGAYLFVGDYDRAFAYLQQAYREHSNLTTLKVNPDFDPVRNDPRFQELLRRLHLDR